MNTLRAKENEELNITFSVFGNEYYNNESRELQIIVI